MSSTKWNAQAVGNYIINGVEENSTLEYKGAYSLEKTDSKKKEIAKDVSAMANSAGGVIIYGVSEYQQREKRHLPEKFDPIDRTQFSKEWLEQVISSNIKPRIEGLRVEAVEVNAVSNGVIYVIEIPESTTAHQVTASNDFRYYRRYNFEAAPMEDYEIRLVMNRARLPKVSVEIGYHVEERAHNYHWYSLDVFVRNQGVLVVQNFKIEITFPVGVEHILTGSLSKNVRVTYDDYQNPTITCLSTSVLFPQDGLSISSEATWRYKMNDQLRYVINRDLINEQAIQVKWTVFADNMLPSNGSLHLSQLHEF